MTVERTADGTLSPELEAIAAAAHDRLRAQAGADLSAIDQVTIDDALERFLAEQRARLAERTYRRYEEVISLLRHSLDGYAYSSLSAAERARWQKAYDEGDEQAYCHLFGPKRIVEHLGSFLDWFMVRKVMAGQELLRASGTVTGKLVRWLSERGHIDGETATDAVDHAREAARDLPTADRLGMLLHDACEDPSDLDPNEVADEDWVEEHLEITDVEPGRIWFERGIGPIEVPRDASDLARPGWQVLITAARLDGRWRLLEVGFVYP